VFQKVALTLLMALLLSSAVSSAGAWSNGGFSPNPDNPKYGTHDWIAEHALDWLPPSEKQYLVNNIKTYLYGTELPDQTATSVSDHIGDMTKHHVYFRSDGSLQDDAAAVRAAEEYANTLNHLKAGRLSEAARVAGVMSHYIADMAVFGHVMGSGTEWGAEKHHSDYEERALARTDSYASPYFTLTYDGSLSRLSAYDAARNLAYNTTFGSHGFCECVWMDKNYDWDNPAFKDRCNESLNLAVNLLSDVLHTLYLDSNPGQAYLPPVDTSLLVGIGAAAITIIALILVLRRLRRT